MPGYFRSHSTHGPGAGRQYGRSRYGNYDDDGFEGSDGAYDEFVNHFDDLNIDDPWIESRFTGHRGYATEECWPSPSSPPGSRHHGRDSESDRYGRGPAAPRNPHDAYDGSPRRIGRRAYSGPARDEDAWYQQRHPREERSPRTPPMRHRHDDQYRYEPRSDHGSAYSNRTGQHYRAEEVRPYWANADGWQPQPESPPRGSRHQREPARRSSRYGESNRYPHEPEHEERAYSGRRRRTPSPGFPYVDPYAEMRRAEASYRSRHGRGSYQETPPRGFRTEERRPGSDYGRSQRSGAGSPEYDDYPYPDSTRGGSRNHGVPSPEFGDYPPAGAGSHRGGYGGGARSRGGSNSTRGGRPAGQSRAQPSAAEKKARFDTYNKKWEALSRIDPVYPLPRPSKELKDPSYLSMSPEDQSQCSDDDALIANVQNFFLGGFGMEVAFSWANDRVNLMFTGHPPKADLEALAKYLRRKEQPRWHPDKMNLRTGVQGKLDEKIGARKEVVTIRTAVQYLLACCQKAIDEEY